MKTNWEEIAGMYKAGVKIKDICEKVGCADSTVYRILRSREIPLRREVDEGKIFALYKAGWKVRDIAGDMGITEIAVCKVLRRKN